jgi:hypothetical protein
MAVRHPPTPVGLRSSLLTQARAVGSGLVSETVDSLILDLLEWIGPGPRPYAEVLDAWRTSCPRLPVWEEATARGLVAREHELGRGSYVSVSTAGLDLLRACGRPTYGA